MTAETPPDSVRSTGARVGRRQLAFGIVLLTPALVLLGALVAYPVFFTIGRSLFDRSGNHYIGLDNYRTMLDRSSTRTAIGNNIVWVVVAPALVTAVGLVLAVLIEKIRFGTAFKVMIFMPLAISFLAAGVIFRFVYEQNPNRGLANAVATAISGLWDHSGEYPGARPSSDQLQASGSAFVGTKAVPTGMTALIGMVGLRPAAVPSRATAAAQPAAAGDAIAGTVWLDVGSGAGGTRGAIDDGERGLPGVEVQALDGSGHVQATATSANDGRFVLDHLDPASSYRLRLTASNFDKKWAGWLWLGETEVTPIGPAVVTISVIIAYLWIWAGFAMVVIAAGLAAIPREVQEAARVDGGTELQVFAKVTVPLLWPVLLVVVTTLVINVLKIFDLVLVIPQGSAQDRADVIALELWRVSFGGARDQGLGSALGVLLFVLVVPFMVWNIRRFRIEQR